MVPTGIPFYSVFVFCMSMAALSLAPMISFGEPVVFLFLQMLSNQLYKDWCYQRFPTFPVVVIVPVNT